MQKNKLRVYWFGYGGSAHLAEDLRPIINDLGMTLTTIHEHDNADIKWERSTWLNELKKADIIIIPTNYKEQPAKSNNRLSQALSLGKPVICSPLDSYCRIEGFCSGSCMFAETKEEWKQHLTTLRDCEDIRESMSKAALEAAKDFSIDSIANQWVDLFNNLEKTDIIIPTYNNLKCLKLCLDSIRKCTKTLYNIIVVNNGPDEKVHKYLDDQGDIIYVKQDRLNFAQAINVGLKVSKSKYVCLLNDDTIVSNNWLKNIIQSYTSDIGAVGVLSNCDKKWLHDIDIKIGDIDLLPGLNTIAQINPIIEDIYNYKYESDDSRIHERDWLAFYCIFMSREIVDKVGLLDEKFTNSGEDVDYCYRIKKQGYKLIQNYNSFVFHFGAVGRKVLEKENKDKYQEEQKQTNAYLREKWG